jgi:hypothetical protein
MSPRWKRKVIEDWHPNPKDAAIRQKLVEITVCEWWPGMKVRLPVTMLAPAKGVCTNVLIENTSAQLKVTAASGAKLRLLKEHGVGLVFIGCVPIDTMEPVGKLHTMMEERFIQTKRHALHARLDLGHQRHARAHHRDGGKGRVSAEKGARHRRLEARRRHRRRRHRG